MQNNNQNTSRNNATINTTNKEDATMKNINTTANKNLVELANMAGTTYFKINGKVAGPIGGTKKNQENNLRCIQFMANQCEAGENAISIINQCNMLTMVMANLENVCLDDTIVLDSVEYIIDTENKKVYAENGEEVLNMLQVYPNLENVNMTSEAVRAILVGELQKNKIAPVAKHPEEASENEGINITGDPKLSVIDTIKGLKALGMSASWFDVNGRRQSFPLCYNGDADLGSFTKIVKDCLNNKKNYLSVIFASCCYKENGVNLTGEVFNVLGFEVAIDYGKKEIWSIDGIEKYADLSDIEYNLPEEAVKVMLLQRAESKIQELLEEEEDYNYEDEEDWYNNDEEDWYNNDEDNTDYGY